MSVGLDLQRVTGVGTSSTTRHDLRKMPLELAPKEARTMPPILLRRPMTRGRQSSAPKAPDPSVAPPLDLPICPRRVRPPLRPPPPPAAPQPQHVGRGRPDPAASVGGALLLLRSGHRQAQGRHRHHTAHYQLQGRAVRRGAGRRRCLMPRPTGGGFARPCLHVVATANTAVKLHFGWVVAHRRWICRWSRGGARRCSRPAGGTRRCRSCTSTAGCVAAGCTAWCNSSTR